MITYKCLVADDNVVERHLLSMFLQKISNIKIVAECDNGIDAANILASEHIDIVFTDIDMPDLNGVSLLKSLRNPPVFIFITSFADYATESYNLDAIDFILKPLTFERLLQAVNKASEYIQLKELLKLQKSAPDEATKQAENEFFADDHCFIKETKGITRLKYADVLFIETMGDFSKISTIHQQTHIVLSGLKHLLDQLSPSIFKRVHKQYAVNLNHIQTVTAVDIQLYGSQTVPLSNMYRQELLDAFVNKDVIKRKN